ncbi:hypothetical protein D3C81_2067580 [compost metagenome]
MWRIAQLEVESDVSVAFFGWVSGDCHGSGVSGVFNFNGDVGVGEVSGFVVAAVN